MSHPTAGRVALVTGASRGIGRAIALELARHGARLTLVSRGVSALEKVKAEAESLGAKCRIEAGDVGDPDFCRGVVARVAESVGPVDILVNNAGVGVFRPMSETQPDELEAPLKVPVLAALVLTHACLPSMLERRDGVIVNMTSVGGKIAIPNCAAYTAARYGVTGMTESLQLELRGTGVTAILVCPGEVTTEYFEKNRSSPDDLPRSRKLFRLLSSEQVGRATVKAIGKRRQLVVIPPEMAMFVRFHRAFPPLGRWMMRVLG